MIFHDRGNPVRLSKWQFSLISSHRKGGVITSKKYKHPSITEVFSEQTMHINVVNQIGIRCLCIERVGIL